MAEQRETAHAAEIASLHALQEDTADSNCSQLKEIKEKHDAEIARLQEQINNLAPGPLQQFVNYFAKKPANNNKVLKTRRTDHVIESKICNKNKIIPAEDQLSYDN